MFKNGLTKLQDKLDVRFYTTSLQFAHDLCQAINLGINTTSSPPSTETNGPEPIEASPAKQSNYADVRDRRRLGKRILKTVQPQLEAALKAESDICSKPIDALLKELEGMLDSSLEIKQHTIEAPHDQVTAGPEQAQDVEMVDAPEEAQIIVADQSDGDVAVKIDGEAGPYDPMDTDVVPRTQGNIEVNTSDRENASLSRPTGVISSGGSPLGERQLASTVVQVNGASHKAVNGFKKVDSGSPPSLSAFGSSGLQPPQHSGPLTPPQSNGSFGRDPANMLSEGGVPWYLQGFDLKGTSAVEEQWTGRDAVRSLSEELTDMDDDALKDLEFDVDDDTITASPVNAGADGELVDGNSGSAKAVRKRERANPAKFRKGVRSSARRR